MWELQCACVVSKATEDSGSNANSEHQGWCHQIKRFSDERNSLSSVLLWGIHIAGAGADFRSCISMPCPKAFIPSARDVGWNLAGFQAPHGAQDNLLGSWAEHLQTAAYGSPSVLDRQKFGLDRSAEHPKAQTQLTTKHVPAHADSR